MFLLFKNIYPQVKSKKKYSPFIWFIFYMVSLNLSKVIFSQKIKYYFCFYQFQMAPIFTIKEFHSRYNMYLQLVFGEIFNVVCRLVLNMDCILTGVAVLVYVVWCVYVFVLFPSHSKNTTGKSDLKFSDCRKYEERNWSAFLTLKHD